MYQRSITHNNRALFIFAIDCSTSMREMTRLNTIILSKAKAAALICNYFIDELLERARRNGVIRNYYDIAVIGYSGDDSFSMLTCADSELVSIERLAGHCPPLNTIHLEQQLPTGHTTSVPFMLHEWITPMHENSTPMYAAMTHIYDLVKQWCKEPDNRESFPPIVINISDGDCSDSEDSFLLDITDKIKATATEDGNTLIINIHLASVRSNTPSIVFPGEKSFKSNDHNCMLLYEMSSTIPQELETTIAALFNKNEKGPYRGVAYNSIACDILSIMNIGTRSINQTSRYNSI